LQAAVTEFNSYCVLDGAAKVNWAAKVNYDIILQPKCKLAMLMLQFNLSHYMA